MGKYTVHGTPQFERRLDCELKEVVDAVCTLPQSCGLQAIVLTGGYGRGEGTPFQKKGEQTPFNDYDLVVVSHPLSRAARKQLQGSLHQIEKQCSDKLGIPVDLYLHTTHTLQSAEASLLNYEMRIGHQVLYGAHDIFSLMPSYNLANLCLSEGTRLLLNRGKLLLDVKVGLGGPRPLTEEELLRFQKFIWKCHLAFGDCVLLAHGDYDVSYITKTKRIENYVSRRDIPDASWMVEHYQKAVDFKLMGDLTLLGFDDLFHAFSKTLRYYLEFLLWYEGRRLGLFLPSLQTYVAQLPRQRASPTDIAKALILNGRILGSGMIDPTPQWALIHPRNRLYPALWLLLSFESSMQLNLRLVQQLLNGGRDYNMLLKRFYEIRARLA